MLGRHVQRRVQVRGLPRDAADDDDALLRARARSEEVRDGELRRADRVREVDVQAGVAAGVGRVAAGGLARGVPEGGPVRVVDAGAGADDVHGLEVLFRGGEEVGERGPGRHVGFYKAGAGGGGGVFLQEGLGFRAEGEVGEDDVAAVGEEEGREAEVYSWECEFGRKGVAAQEYVPEPAPVTMAVFPLTENGAVPPFVSS